MKLSIRLRELSHTLDIEHDEKIARDMLLEAARRIEELEVALRDVLAQAGPGSLSHAQARERARKVLARAQETKQ